MFYIILLSALFIDLISKYYFSHYLAGKINIIGDYIYLSFIENTGIAFSMQMPSILLKIITIILIIAIFYYYKIEKKKKGENIGLFNISFALILAGAIGNGLERVFNGKVVDFIGVKYFAVFNLADVFITIGAIIYIYYEYSKHITHTSSGITKGLPPYGDYAYPSESEGIPGKGKKS